MTDTRRKAAEEYANGIANGDSITSLAIRTIASISHFDGQECGEQRAVGGIVRLLTHQAKKWEGTQVQFTLNLMAEQIERGEWKEDGK